MKKELIYIGFSKARGTFPILSWLIRLIEQTPYSHVYLRIPSTWLQTDTYFQASGLMVNFMGPDVFAKNAQVVEEFPIWITPETKKKIWQFAIRNAGKPYSIKQLPGIGIIKLGRLFGQNWNNPFKDGRASYICVELIAELLIEYLGASITKDLDSIGFKETYPQVRQISSSRSLA